MSQSFWNEIAITPWWLFVLYFLLLRFSWLQSRPHILSLAGVQLSLIPLMLCLGVTIYAFPPSLQITSYAIVMMLAGFLLSTIRLSLQRIMVIPQSKNLLSRGTYLPFICMVSFIILSIYCTNVLHINGLAWLKEHASTLALPLYGLALGIAASQWRHYRRLLQNGPIAEKHHIPQTLAHLYPSQGAV